MLARLAVLLAVPAFAHAGEVIHYRSPSSGQPAEMHSSVFDSGSAADLESALGRLPPTKEYLERRSPTAACPWARNAAAALERWAKAKRAELGAPMPLDMPVEELADAAMRRARAVAERQRRAEIVASVAAKLREGCLDVQP